MNTRRNALALAGVLTATVLTGGFAVGGILHRPVAATPVPIIHLSPRSAASPAPTWADD